MTNPIRRGRLLVANLLGLALRCSSRQIGLALAYHRVGDPQGDPARELMPALGIKLFEAQLSHLAAHYRIVAASQLTAAIRSRRRGQRFPVAITFDDDLKSHAGVSMPLLERARLPATFFLCGASLTAPWAFWWERLQEATDRGLHEGVVSIVGARPPTDSGRASVHELASEIEAMAPDARRAAEERLAEELGAAPSDAGLRARDVKALVDAGFELGFHTRRHDAMPSLDDDRLATAMVEGRSELAAIAGHPITMIAYPHGKTDARVAARARAAGYVAGFTTAPQPVDAATDALLLGRLQPSYRSPEDFACCLVRALIRDFIGRR